jgi:hypothetical protein
VPSLVSLPAAHYLWLFFGGHVSSALSSISILATHFSVYYGLFSNSHISGAFSDVRCAVAHFSVSGHPSSDHFLDA